MKLRRARAGSPPPAPEGVWLEYLDGDRYENIPTVYVGTDEDGIACFELIAPRAEPPTSAGAAVWPGMTAIQFPMLAPGSETP